MGIDTKVRSCLDDGEFLLFIDRDPTVFGERDENDVGWEDSVRCVKDDIAGAGMSSTNHTHLGFCRMRLLHDGNDLFFRCRRSKRVGGEGIDARITKGVFVRVGAIRCIPPWVDLAHWWIDRLKDVLKFGGECFHVSRREFVLLVEGMMSFDEGNHVFFKCVWHCGEGLAEMRTGREAKYNGDIPGVISDTPMGKGTPVGDAK